MAKPRAVATGRLPTSRFDLPLYFRTTRSGPVEKDVVMTDLSLPVDHFKKLAKTLNKKVGDAEPDACARVRAVYKDASEQTDAEVASGFGLMRAQHVIAREHGFESWSALLASSGIEARLAITMARLPDLNNFGIGLFPDHYKKPKAEQQAIYEKNRADLRAAVEPVQQTVDWLRQNVEPIKTINTKHSSYGLKHLAEKEVEVGYITNGMFIAAAIIAGYEYRIEPGSPNVAFGMSEKSISDITKRRKEPPAPKAPRPTPSVRHFYLEDETDYEVTVTVDMQTVAHFTMGGGPLTNAGIKNRKFGWFSSWDPWIGPMRAGWVVDEGTWSPEWEPTERELHDLAEKAMADELLHRFKHVLVIHAPRKLAMLASDRPLPHGNLTSALSALPRQQITEGPPPSWWPDGTGRPDIKTPEPVPVDEEQEDAFADLVVALERANGQVTMATLGSGNGNEPIRAAIRTARELLERVQLAAETPRQKRLAKRALGYEAHWKRTEESLDRIEAMDRGIFLPVR